VPLYVHSIVTAEQVRRLGTVRKAVLAAVVICENVRQDGGGEKSDDLHGNPSQVRKGNEAAGLGLG
jgi:hypothetical protein